MSSTNELPAIVGALREYEYIELEEDRLRRERDETYRRNKEAERVRLEEKFLSGADSGWTPVKGSVDQIVARLHARGKTNEAHSKGLRDPVEEDAELAIQALGFALCDIGWAT